MLTVFILKNKTQGGFNEKYYFITLRVFCGTCVC